MLQSFQLGGFAVSITGRSWHSVGMDEAHEMLVNKDCKISVVRPTKEFVSRRSMYFPFRASVLHNIRKQLHPEADDQRSSVVASKNRDIKARRNTEVMRAAISSSDILPKVSTSGCCLRNAFTGKIASTSEQHDLLKFREIGNGDFDEYVQHSFLGTPSVQPVTRSHRLKTFASSTKINKRNYSSIQREKNLVTKCLKSMVLWAQMHGGSGDTSQQQQFLELPRAIATEGGIPTKGQKSHTTSFYLARYANQAIIGAFPLEWHPDVVVIEGMFMINSTPLKIHATVRDYADFLLVRYAGCYMSSGVREVHLVFDDPNRFPKAIEQSRRDANCSSPDHEHVSFSENMIVPSKWRDILDCRKCKRKLVVYMGESLLQVAPKYLHEDQKLFVAGCSEELDRDQVWYTTGRGIEQLAPELKGAAEEGDTRVWLHVERTAGSKKLVYSPDTDVYHIGLTTSLQMM